MDEGFLLVVAVVTTGPVHVGLYLHRYRYAAQTGSRCVTLLMVMVMVVAVAVPAVVPTRRISTVFGLECFVHRGHDEVHGTQHVCQHMIRFDLEVVAL